MKKILLLSVIASGILALASCGGASGNDPGRAYMPDMYYSRAYEAYGYNNTPEDHDLASRHAYYNAMPVPGTRARGDNFVSYMIPGDSGYARAASYPSPLASMNINPKQLLEAERLYLINCGICHGTALDGNGPLWKGGDGPYPAAPRNLKDDYTKKLSDGQIYHVITYGKGQMGAYGSQVKPEQRWWITQYIRSKQGPATAATTATDTAAVAAPAAAAAGTAAPSAGTNSTGAAANQQPK
jgi:mono/diheme cytochrome c family protein